MKKYETSVTIKQRATGLLECPYCGMFQSAVIRLSDGPVHPDAVLGLTRPASLVCCEACIDRYLWQLLPRWRQRNVGERANELARGGLDMAIAQLRAFREDLDRWKATVNVIV